MKALKILIALLIFLNLPAVVLASFGSTLGSLLSYISILLLIVYYMYVENKTAPNNWLLVLALFYFLISSFQYYARTSLIIADAVKYFIVIICGYELIKKIDAITLFYILLVGGLSIGFEAVFFQSKFGRYSGFYINPNVAGFICIFGYSITYALKKGYLQLIGQFIFTLMGLLTFSRTFIVIWILVNLISLKISIKNIKILGVGFLIISSLFLIDELVGLENPRFQQLKDVLNNEQVDRGEISEDSRSDTWALFYDDILESPIFGSGYGTFSGKLGRIGAHNSYLMIIGEAGIIPFLILIFFFIYLFHNSIILFKQAPNLIMQTIALSVFLLANHNFFVFYYLVFSTMWIQSQIIYFRKTKALS